MQIGRQAALQSSGLECAAQISRLRALLQSGLQQRSRRQRRPRRRPREGRGAALLRLRSSERRSTRSMCVRLQAAVLRGRE